MSDRPEIEKCTTFEYDGRHCVITCSLGNWSVEGTYGVELLNEANHYFQLYKSDGEYDLLLEITK